MLSVIMALNNKLELIYVDEMMTSQCIDYLIQIYRFAIKEF
jgi:hypothetical protein